ncbi:MAG: SGNH/GDSL hydrolase family protein [Candidatus Eisenbacteria bacterium]
MRYLALGDSYTIGEGVPEADRWPVQLVVRLRTAGIPLAEPQLIARTGWTTDELDAAITATAPTAHCELVTLSIGVNNQYRGRDLTQYSSQFASLLERSVKFADGHAGRVIVVSIPDWGVTAFAQGRDREKIATEIDTFNAAASEIAKRRGARWVSVTEASRRHGADAPYLAEDGLHPSALAYAEWAALVEKAALEALAH